MTDPYHVEPNYSQRWVVDGWDGVNRYIDRDGTVRFAPNPALPRVPQEEPGP